ncbi:LysR family transcriptional regulator [Allorhizobium taibaishanense]|uniref:HTH-type transcriptional regulator TtuA n=1 Tax=Allorhizobium taibaishanense TaxID=887144 RepID=A0A1Q9A3X5_9HYPH|nr:LysR family transcriptional regulator [Allorhizobium taibaishanense]MBB4006270.1 DNA-binding transcriptional LysR family regulator [Allorhizobium taibaishanense]OLP49242.1 LysR family transcriptional regulator [Allorhizobium taibaishanense]
MPDLPLADLDAFATIARLKNFRAAGKLRGVSASSLSEAMRRLEARVGVRLLNRTTRSVTLTDAGARLLERLSPTLSEIELALDDINQFRERPFGRLRLNVPGIVARCVLPEIVNGFLQAYPDIVVEVSVNDALIDVLAEGFDAGIRYEESLHRDMIAVPIGPRRQRYVCVASLDYLARHGMPADPGALVDHHSVLHRFAAGLVNEWRFERGGQTINVTPPPRLIAETVDLELAAVRAGLGLMRTFEDFVADDIAAGRLVRVLTDWEDEFSGPFLYYHSRRQMPVPLRVFIDHVRQLGAR